MGEFTVRLVNEITVVLSPWCSTTVVSPAVFENPVPVISSVVWLERIEAGDRFTVGFAAAPETVATCFGADAAPCTVTVAVSAPADGGEVNASVSDVAVAKVTVAVPLDSVTTLSAGAVLNPMPAITRLPDGATAAVLDVTVTACWATTVATVTVALVPSEFVTVAVRSPSDGVLLIDSVRLVAVAAVTVAVPLESVTWLFAGVVSKPAPSSVSTVALARSEGSVFGSSGSPLTAVIPRTSKVSPAKAWLPTASVTLTVKGYVPAAVAATVPLMAPVVASRDSPARPPLTTV